MFNAVLIVAGLIVLTGIVGALIIIGVSAFMVAKFANHIDSQDSTG